MKRVLHDLYDNTTYNDKNGFWQTSKMVLKT